MIGYHNPTSVPRARILTSSITRGAPIYLQTADFITALFALSLNRVKSKYTQDASKRYLKSWTICFGLCAVA